MRMHFGLLANISFWHGFFSKVCLCQRSIGSGIRRSFGQIIQIYQKESLGGQLQWILTIELLGPHDMFLHIDDSLKGSEQCVRD
jgi:hypothetical protein